MPAHDVPPALALSASRSFRPATEQLLLLTLISTSVARRHRLSPDDALDFGQNVQLKFLENDYEALRRFDGRSSLRTYVTVVVGRLLIDWQRALRGRWRASAKASRDGSHAVALEELVCRDGHPLDEAVEILATAPDGPKRSELWRAADRLDVRPPHRTTSVPLTPATAAQPFIDPLLRAEETSATRQLQGLIARAVRDLPAADRRLLHRRYVKGQHISSMAATSKGDVKRLYRRHEQVLRSLRTAVQHELGGAATAPSVMVRRAGT